MSKDWWWHPTDGPRRHDTTSPAATSVFGPITLSATLACRPTRAASATTDRSTTAIPVTAHPHWRTESATRAPDSTTAGSPGPLRRVVRRTAVAPSTTAAGPT